MIRARQASDRRTDGEDSFAVENTQKESEVHRLMR